MLFNRTGFRTVVETCGLTKPELAKIFSVARQHVYALYKKSTPRNDEAIRKFNLYTEALLHLRTIGQLPLKPSVTKEQRGEAVTALTKLLYDRARPQ